MNSGLEESVIKLKEYLQSTYEYKKVLELKKQMEKSVAVNKLVQELKDTQKEYIRNEKDPELKKKLQNIEKKLNEIPIYHEYNKNLEKINDQLFVVKEELNEYFDKKINN